MVFRCTSKFLFFPLSMLFMSNYIKEKEIWEEALAFLRLLLIVVCTNYKIKLYIHAPWMSLGFFETPRACLFDFMRIHYYMNPNQRMITGVNVNDMRWELRWKIQDGDIDRTMTFIGIELLGWWLIWLFNSHRSLI